MDTVYFTDVDGKKKILTEEFWNALSSGSEEYDDSDLDPTIDPNILFKNLDNIDCSDDELSNVSSDENVEIEVPSNEQLPSTSSTASESTESKQKKLLSKSKQHSSKVEKKKRLKLLWKRKVSSVNEPSILFSGNSSLPQNILNLKSPYEFFSYFFPSELIDFIASQSVLYSVQKDPAKPANISSSDIRKYLGICIMSSVACLKNIRMYWHPVVGIPLVQNTMTLNRFENIRRYLHFNDNSACLTRSDIEQDKLYKLRPIITRLQNSFLSVPMEESLCVDEQICATKARHHLKQYMPAKPHKYGYKLFVLSGISGFAYNFEIYSGQENSDSNRLPEEADLGASSNVVMRLTRSVTENVNHKLYFDNYYTSVQLLKSLKYKGILSLGTVRRNRVPDCKLPSDVELKKEPRGSINEYVAEFEGCELYNVSWKDNKTVIMLSTFAGTNPVREVKRFDRKEKCHKKVTCPYVITTYNKHMGGVDLLDSLIGRYKIGMRSKKWYFRIFYHLVDLAVINSWLLSKRVNEQIGSTGVEMKLSQFRLDLAESLCSYGPSNSTKRGRPPNGEKEPPPKKVKSISTRNPPVTVRCDKIDHWPEHIENKQRCKMSSCKGFTRIKCTKCDVPLCLNKNNNCFQNYHLK